MQTCAIQGHDLKHLVRICLQKDCMSNQLLICDKCVDDSHSNHQNECITFQQLHEKSKIIDHELFIKSDQNENETFTITQKLEQTEKNFFQNIHIFQQKIEKVKKQFKAFFKNYKDFINEQINQFCKLRTNQHNILTKIKQENFQDLIEFEKNLVTSVIKNPTQEAEHTKSKIKFLLDNVVKFENIITKSLETVFQNKQSELLTSQAFNCFISQDIALNSIEEQRWEVIQTEYGVYEGDVVNGKKNGTGKLQLQDGRMQKINYQKKKKRIEGVWQDDQLKQKGKVIFPNGTRYEGELTSNYEMTGKGILYFYNGDKQYMSLFNLLNRYEGKLKGGVFHGKGTFQYLNGSKYIGKWHQGKKNGFGELTNVNKERYIGLFKDDNFNGQGTYRCSDESIYSGYFYNGLLKGLATHTYHDSMNQFGLYQNGLPIGKHAYFNKNNQIISILEFNNSGQQISCQNV